MNVDAFVDEAMRMNDVEFSRMAMQLTPNELSDLVFWFLASRPNFDSFSSKWEYNQVVIMWRIGIDVFGEIYRQRKAALLPIGVMEESLGEAYAAAPQRR